MPRGVYTRTPYVPQGAYFVCKTCGVKEVGTAEWRSYCAKCRKKRNSLCSKRNYAQKKDTKLVSMQTYYYTHKEQVIARQRIWNRLRVKTPKERIDRNIGSQMRRYLKEKKGGRSWKTLVDYSLDDLMAHFESQFDEKMNWENYGSYWSVDHIKPMSLFKYDSTDDPEFKACWALSNLRPLNHIENIKKGNKYEMPTLQ